MFELRADLNDTERTMILIDLARFAVYKSLDFNDNSLLARKILAWWASLDTITQEALEDMARECSCEELLDDVV